MSEPKRCPMPDDVCADCGYRCCESDEATGLLPPAPSFPRLLFPFTSWQLLTLAQRYEGARNYIQGFYYPERKKPHVIRDMRRVWSAQIIYETDDEDAYRDNLQIEYMRFALEPLSNRGSSR